MQLLALIHEIQRFQQELANLKDECQMQFLRKQDKETVFNEVAMKEAELCNIHAEIQLLFESKEYLN